MSEALRKIIHLYQSAKSAEAQGAFATAESLYLDCIAFFQMSEGENSLDVANCSDAPSVISASAWEICTPKH
jgi:hypothetical protein